MDSTEKRRLFRKVALISLVGCIVLAAGGGAVAQSGRAEVSSGLITLDVADADLSTVVRMLLKESKQSIIIVDDDKLHTKVSATLKDMPLETALKYIVASVGCSWHREPDGTYIIGSKAQSAAAEFAAEAAPEPTAPLADGGLASYTRGPERQFRRETRVESVKLHNTNPVDIMWLLGLYDYGKAPEIQAARFKPAVYLPNARPVGPADITPPLTESLRPYPTEAGRVPSLSSEAAQAPPPRPPTTRPRPGTPGAPTAPGAPGTAAADLLPEGIDYMMPYELDNSLIVKGTDEGIDELKEIIKQLDIAPRQVSIKAEFVEISTSQASALGIDWSLQRMNTSFETQFGPKGNVIVGFASGNVMANLRTQLLQNKAKLVNAPIISTLNNVPAVISVGTEVPYWTSFVQSVGTAGQTVSQQVVNFLPVQSTLTVIPRINGDNSITVFLQPIVSETGDPVKGPDGTEIPVTSQQSLQTNRRVMNGETIVVGGIIRKSDSTNVSKIPLLGDLPIVGPLFRSTTKSTNDREMLIFLTPTIVPERSPAGAGIGVAL